MPNSTLFIPIVPSICSGTWLSTQLSRRVMFVPMHLLGTMLLHACVSAAAAAAARTPRLHPEDRVSERARHSTPQRPATTDAAKNEAVGADEGMRHRRVGGGTVGSAPAFPGMQCADIGCGTWSIVCSCDMQCASVYNDCCSDWDSTCGEPAATQRPATTDAAKNEAGEEDPEHLDGEGGLADNRVAPGVGSCIERCGDSWDDDPNALCYCDIGCAEYNGKSIHACTCPVLLTACVRCCTE